jgi:site-specific DNA-methyltransferase (adenine-specific)
MIKLIHGDCLEKMAEIEDSSVDMVLADPPYGTTACKWDSIIPLEPMWEHLKRVIKPNGAIVMTASQPFTTALIASNMKMFKYCWVWEKEQGTGLSRCKYQPMRKSEDVLVFSMGCPTYNPQMVKRAKPIKIRSSFPKLAASDQTKNFKSYERISIETYPTNILRINRDRKRGIRGLHPTQKPVALMEYLIKTYTNEGETVLDFTMGSGTTGVACVNLNRSFIGIEKDAEYFQLASDRINSHNSKSRHQPTG